MNLVPESVPPQKPRMLTFRSGGWILLLAGALMAATLTWHIATIVPTLGGPAIGDGKNVETYGFDLSTCLVPRDLIVAGGAFIRKNGMPAMVDPATLPVSRVVDGSKLAGVQKLTPSDRVIGVVVGGEARAYPLWVLTWHEIVNDTLAGEPILVTYSPLCDAAVVFDRTVDGETIEFRHSGLLFNSNLLMYDQRADDAAESLWSQLQSRAVAGPAAQRAAVLDVRGCLVVPWAEWRERYPDSTVVLPDPERKKVYRRKAYSHYFGNEKLMFPVRPLPERSGRLLKARVVASRRDGVWNVSDAADFSPARDWSEHATVYAFWFAWNAMHAE